ncbi:MAG TPA: type II toxin-antitoxin system prevent-host-death family antitoxin [Geminicoccaceae bacterium]|nr:type II toxin-antitoxin system prevent-host-death family antitoxin [Geminicoccus sp.]HMU51557.1 type II toxin-antitoxin system prevent-host-death family antitoxin [Geminicoccaceae bacterium]
MASVGAFEAKTHLSALLERVAGGEEIEITRHGKAIARLVPARQPEPLAAAQRVERMKALSRGNRLDGLSWKELRDEGRR